MKVNLPEIDHLLSPITSHFRKDNFTHEEINLNPPLRAELFSKEQMDQHAKYLANHHFIITKDSPELLLKELSDNEDILFDVNELLKQSVIERKSVSPAAEWLLDNFYLTDEQIRIAKRYLPKGYSKGLPKLKNGFPRVYDIAIEIISHSDGRIDILSLTNFIIAYQKESQLTLGELWAIPIMLRLALLENLARVAARIAVGKKDSGLANDWAKQIIETVEKKPKDLVLIIADMARSNPPMVSAFVAEFARKLQWKGPEFALPLNWVEQHLSGTEDTVNSMVLIENQKQAADQVSVSNSISSLRFLAKMDWREFVEAISGVEHILRKDIDDVYATMDFYTRDEYRHKVEGIAKASGLSESEIAGIAIDLALQSAVRHPADKRKAHVGYYLTKEGVDEVEKRAGFRLTIFQLLRRKVDRAGSEIYITISLVITFLIGASMMLRVIAENLSIGWLILTGAVCLLCASHLALAVTNWWATLWIKPKPLAKLDFSLGIPMKYRTIVVVPTMLVNPTQIDRLLEDLEVRFLANRDPNLLFALLTDFQDAKLSNLPGDDELILLAQRGIERLNKKYDRLVNDTFFLFHRPRTWNVIDKIWMGYERKRGKLSELNHLLRGEFKDRFSCVVGEEKVYTTVKYVITLDTDTQLPRDAAWKLVGLMAHPLNHAVYDEKKKRIVEGYTIIQPRIAISLHGAIRSGYSRLYENDAGIDPYTRVTSDVYQDVFGEGSFIGKGIYEIDAFEKALNNRFPENRILSHDLLEGSYARCGFASDVQLYEDYPSGYRIDISRRYRWIRGDWQIANWCLPFVPDAKGGIKRNALSSLSRWKIFDNLRRSLVPIAFVVLLLAGWTILSYAWFWSLIVLAIIFIPSFISSIWNLLVNPEEIDIRQHITNATSLTSKSILQAAFTVACLPYEAFISVDAIVRTIWRLTFSGKRLLEWNPSGIVLKQKEGLLATYQAMWISPVLASGVLAYLVIGSFPALWIATPFLFIWMLSPAVVNVMGKPAVASKSKLEPDQKTYLRELARKTWSFFEKLVGPEDNWLPPDNLQLYPIPIIAHRTSPTNIGLSLLANLSACDFGYITSKQLLEQTANTFTTLGKLERHKGHFYNWYDTQSLATLSPRYISTVDSGNLAGHLLTLRQGLLSIPQQKIIEPKVLYGLQDTLRLALKELSMSDKAMHFELEYFYESIETQDFHLPALKEHFEDLLFNYHEIVYSGNKEKIIESEWLLVFEQHLEMLRHEIFLLAPWLSGLTIPEKFVDWKVVVEVPTLKELATMDDRIKSEMASWRQLKNSEQENQWLSQFEMFVNQASRYARERMSSIQTLAAQCYEFADMEYEFLYDKSQHLLSIGYNVDEQHRDTGYYDLLASEARLGLFVAIAQGKLPQESWFALGRRLTTVGNTPVLLSWSGSMFEYLMPGLVMPTYENTLLDEMCIGSVKKQIEYGELQGTFWGISESCYNLVDAHLIYQYKAFGIPGLGFKRGLGQELVIAPYATILALMVDPRAACSNLESMKAKGFEGKYGFFEAIDYTPVRLSRGQTQAVLQTFMAHHQGMSLLSITYLLLDQPMQKRFEADIQFQSALLLLQERVPKSTGFYSGSPDAENLTTISSTTDIRIIKSPDTPVPDIQLLSNGRFFVMLSNAGGGYIKWKDIAVTRWREDSTCDNWGMFCYVHDRDKQSFWSIAHQPTLKDADQYEVIFSQGRVEFRRRDDGVETYTVVIVSPEDDVEVRRVHLTNRSRSKKNLEVTSYGEVVLAPAASDDAHPAFSNLFVQTEIKEQQNAIVCTRRPRSKEEHPPWMFHVMKVSGVVANEVSYETDRAEFIGRGYTLRHPKVMDQTTPLSGSHGSVLDPIVSIQYKITLLPGESATLDMVTGIAETREANQSLIDKYQDKHLRDRAFELSWTHSQVVLRQIGATEADAQLYGKLAGSILYMNPALRAPSTIIVKNQRGQSSLWSYSISGDFPIVLLLISDSENISMVKQLIKAQAYWRMNGLTVDLVILNEDRGGYRQALQDQILGIIAAGIGVAEKRGRIFIRPIDQVSDEDRILLQTVARVIISDTKGKLDDQLNKRVSSKVPIPKLIPSKFYTLIQQKLITPTDLQFFNGTGGFSADGKEYVIITEGKKCTPLPWINVMANPHFGTIISERGSSYTWFENAHSFRLTPWKNDAITDTGGEAFYLRDEESGQFWSPMGLPASSSSKFIANHGFGYTNFKHNEDGIRSEVNVHVDSASPIKFVVVKVANQSGRTRKLTATGYIEWVLGELRSTGVMHIVTELHIGTGTLMAKNSFNTEFQDYVGFFDVDDSVFTFTTDRTEFIGRNGTLENPEAMRRTHLSGKSGAGLDSCAAIQVPFELENGKERTIIFKIGAGKHVHEAVATVKRFRGSQAAYDSLDDVKQFWTTTLGAVQVETPDPSINIPANGWLLYQVLSCRLWGRTGFYQSGGAYGFRDQLQDVLALLHSKPDLVRKQILLCSSRQFKEGDVQHWWHPPLGRGVRTLCSDDLLWLPYAVSRYVSATGEVEVLEETTPYLQGRLLNVNEESYFDLPIVSNKEVTVYDHCKQSILHALRFGIHGLPLIGSGDWNDGMNRVGIEGKGESVWLAFFLYDVLMRFSEIAALRNDTLFVSECEKYAGQLKSSIHVHGWDGEWYLRAYFDDGSTLGSTRLEECKIDSLSQSWSVLSGAGENARSLSGMQAVDRILVDRDHGLIKLLNPPFNKMELDPGYIKGYLPGVRENGGQYTHAAIWAVMAYAKLGDHEKTYELLNLINPIHHGKTPQGVVTYRGEPYVMAADVYGISPHTGRGGWTWYTGSAGWMYQLILESFLGLKREGNTLWFEPCIPSAWKSFKVSYRFGETVYSIALNQEGDRGTKEIFMNGEMQSTPFIQLINDGKEHVVTILIGKKSKTVAKDMLDVQDV